MPSGKAGDPTKGREMAVDSKVCDMVAMDMFMACKGNGYGVFICTLTVFALLTNGRQCQILRPSGL